MSNTKISALTAYAGTAVVTANDVMPIVDTANTTTKKIAVSELQIALRGIGMSPITNSLGSDVALNNTGSYFTGPTIAQGTSGTWFASGSVTVGSTAGASSFSVKLWDGTTVIASLSLATSAAIGSSGGITTGSLSGYLASPAGNIRISVQDGATTSGKILFNQSGNSKDSTLSAIRIA